MRQFQLNRYHIPDKYAQGKWFVADSAGRSAYKTILIPLSKAGLIFNICFPIFVILAVLIPLVLIRNQSVMSQALVFTGIVFLLIMPIVIFIDKKLVLNPRKLYFKKLKQLHKDQRDSAYSQLNTDGKALFDSNGSTIPYWINKLEKLDSQSS